MINVFNKNLKFYNNLYDGKSPLWFWLHGLVSFDQQSKTRPNHLILNPFLLEKMKSIKQVRVLDYGCGWGVFLMGLPKHGITCCYYDISSSAMSLAEKMLRLFGKQSESIEVDENGNILQEPFDVIVCSHVLEHVLDDKLLLSKFYSSLKDDGHILLNVPINEIWDDPKHVRKYDVESLNQLVHKCGFEILADHQLDRWTAFLLKYETKLNFSWISKILFKPLRFILAVMPYRCILIGDYKFLRTHAPQQYIIVAKKKV